MPLQLIECIESMKNDVKRKIGMRDHHRAMYAECSAGLRDAIGARVIVGVSLAVKLSSTSCDVPPQKVKIHRTFSRVLS